MTAILTIVEWAFVAVLAALAAAGIVHGDLSFIVPAAFAVLGAASVRGLALKRSANDAAHHVMDAIEGALTGRRPT